jgi:transposase
MWTPTTRQKHSRTVTRYQTDLTDKEWRVIEPHLPKPCATGRPREWPMREIVNGIFYVMRAGCPWRLVPSDLPPWGTISSPAEPLWRGEPAQIASRSPRQTLLIRRRSLN